MTLSIGVPLPCPACLCGAWLAVPSVTVGVSPATPQSVATIALCFHHGRRPRLAGYGCRLPVLSAFRYPPKKPTFATSAVFASVLAASSFSDLISLLKKSWLQIGIFIPSQTTNDRYLPELSNQTTHKSHLQFSKQSVRVKQMKRDTIISKIMY